MKKIKNDKKNRKFHLPLSVVLVSLSFLGILVMGILLEVLDSQREQRDVRRKGDLASVQVWLEEYNRVNGSYPVADEQGRILACREGSPCDWGKSEFELKSGEVKGVLPTDPNRNLSYFYVSSKDGSKYQLYARLERLKDPEVVLGLPFDCVAICNYGITSLNTKIGEKI